MVAANKLIITIGLLTLSSIFCAGLKEFTGSETFSFIVGFVNGMLIGYYIWLPYFKEMKK